MSELRESREALNGRKAYDADGLNELAASIQEHGLLQPILVVPKDDQYRVVCGERRRRADDLPVNLVENIQRVDLSPKEKVAAIRQLAGTGLGVREISRGTGLSAGTISRWLRIADKPAVVQALAEGRIDIGKAQYLAPVKEAEQVDALLARAPSMPLAEFARLAQGVVSNNTYRPDDGRLADIDRKLALVRTVTPVGHAHLLRIRERVEALLRQAAIDATASALARAEDPRRQPRP